jgi:glucuronoarabinoxylan endo-1,4-beta-xylanase
MNFRKKFLSLFLAIVLIALNIPVISASAETDGAINVFWDKERQTIDGFGASFSFRQSENVLNHYPEETQNELLDLMFDKEKGIGLSIVRNMVGDDMRVGEYSWGEYGIWWDGPVPTVKTAATHTERPSTIDPATGKSNLDGDNYRWFYDVNEFPGDYPEYYADAEKNEAFNEWGWDLSPMDRGQVWVMKKAQEYAEKQNEEIKMISAIWSPPAWLKSNNSTTGRGNVPAAQYGEFAEYMADYIEGYKKYYDINIYGLSLSNEPSYNGGYSCCQWTNEQLRDAIKVIGPEFENRGITAKLQGTEHMNWNENYITATLNDPEAAKYLDTAIWHPYGSNETTGFGVLPNTKRMGIPIWETEWCNLNNETDNITTALRHARLMNRQLTIAEISAFCFWAGWAYWRGDPDALNNAGIPHDANNGSGGLIYIQKYNETFPGNYYIFKRYYVFGQYSKFIRPDWVRIENEQPVVADLQTSAYKDPATGDFAIVVVNSNSTADRSFNLNLLGADASKVTAWRTSATENLDNLGDVALVNGSATVNIPAMSITTFVGKATAGSSYAVSAYETIDAKLYDSLEGGYLDNNAALSDGVVHAYATSSTSAKATATYNDVNFQSGTLNEMNLRIAHSTSGSSGNLDATVSVYLDGADPENLLASQTFSLPKTSNNAIAYQNVTIPLDKAVSGVNDVVVVLEGAANNRTINLSSFVFGGELDAVLSLSTDGGTVMPGDEIDVYAEFDKVVESNAAVLNFTFDTDKFEYSWFDAADGVNVIHSEETAAGVKIVVMAEDYDIKALGTFVLNALDGLGFGKNEIVLNAEFAVLDGDEKYVLAASASTLVTSVPPKAEGPFTLIELSNIIDIFGVTSEDEGYIGREPWEVLCIWDFNNNGEIDISDISYVAMNLV